MPAVMQCLFYNHGKVSSEEVAQKEQEAMAMTWFLHNSISLITRPLEQLKKLATRAGVPCTEKQRLEKALVIVRAMRDFEHALALWENKTDADKAWENFKARFHEEQLSLKKNRGPTMQQSGHHQANSIATKASNDIQNQLSQRDIQLMAMLHSLPSLSATSSIEEASDQQLPTQAESRAAQQSQQLDTTQKEMLCVLQELSNDLRSTRTTRPQNSRHDNRQRAQRPSEGNQRLPKGSPPQNLRKPNTGGQWRRIISKRCWTHGACAHKIADCAEQAPGHYDNAAFESKMGGNCARCQ